MTCTNTYEFGLGFESEVESCRRVLRLAVSAIGAGALTLVAFYGMQMLVRAPLGAEETSTVRLREVVIPALKPPEHVPFRPALPPKPVTTDRPDHKLVVGPDPLVRDHWEPWKPSEPFSIGEPGRPGTAAPTIDRALMPIVRVEPQYPPQRAARGIEGRVTLRFTVGPTGAVDVDSIKVLEAELMHAFDRAAIRAVRKWRYQPRIVDGKTIAQTGVLAALTFELERD